MVRLQRRRSEVGRARLEVLFARLARLNHAVLGEFGQIGRGVHVPQLSRDRLHRNQGLGAGHDVRTDNTLNKMLPSRFIKTAESRAARQPHFIYQFDDDVEVL